MQYLEITFYLLVVVACLVSIVAQILESRKKKRGE